MTLKDDIARYVHEGTPGISSNMMPKWVRDIAADPLRTALATGEGEDNAD